MIISNIGRYVILLQIAASASFQGNVNASETSNSALHPRRLQGCSAYSKNQDCPRSTCEWSQGNCVSLPATPPPTKAPTDPPVTSSPTDPPTPQPTTAPTLGPTDNPTPRGAGYCSDDASKGCFNASECDCAAAPAAAAAPDSTNLFKRARRNLQTCDLPTCSSASKNKDCTANCGCAWVAGSCVSSTPATGQPTNPPVTSNPTKQPTKSPTLSPETSAPTGAPTPCVCLNVGPTNPPTPEPTGSPTKSPTDSPTKTPTPQPTEIPTNSPTPNPTKSPTNAPSNNPSTSPTLSPTNNPTKSPSKNPTESPTNAPTNNPTGSPTSAPSKSPTDINECPSPGTMDVTTSGLKSISVAAADTFCGFFLKKESGDLIPLARSYHGQDWESAPGPLACPQEDVTATSVYLPALEVDSTDEYVILSKNGTNADRKLIASFLEMTTFGPKLSEINALDAAPWDAAARAAHVRTQMDLPATSHREYWRKRTNSKWEATSQPARSDHPCSPNSKWRKYSYTVKDRYHEITSEKTYSYFEVVPQEANYTYTLHEADSTSDVTGYNSGTFHNAATTGYYGYSGTGYYDFNNAGDFLEWTVNMAEAGDYPVSFRYALGSSSTNGERPLQLYVNNVMLDSVYEFIFTDSWSYWKYSDLVYATLNAGDNTIKLMVAPDKSSGPNIDHLRIGKPPAVVMKTNGWPRVIAKNGIHALNGWGYDFYNMTEGSYFSHYPDPPMGDLYRYNYGRLGMTLPDGSTRYLDIGNPPVDYTGYEQYLPPNVFMFTSDDTFTETASDLYSYPIQKGQELLLTNGFSGLICDSVPPFAEEYDAPIVGQLPSGEWIQWSPTILLEDNGPSINDVDMTSNVLSDGGGETFIQTGEKVKCSNVQRSFINEETCFLSTVSTACSASQPIEEVIIPMNTSNVIEFYNLADKYIYAIRGLVMENIDEHACRKTDSRWTFEVNTTCSAPTNLETNTTIALEDAITSASDANEFIKDVTRTLSCDPSDEITDEIDIQIQIGLDCYSHVHPNHLNVYDFSGWVTEHPGGEYNIQKWAQGWEGNEGWYLDFPFNGNTTRKIQKHGMNRWNTNAVAPNIVYVTRLGDDIAYRDLPNDLKTDAVAQNFGAVPKSVSEGGVVVCGSIGEVSNDPTLNEVFDVRSDEQSTTGGDQFNNQKAVVWTEIALNGQDQLRQRMAWALAQIVTTVPGNIDAYDRTEIYLHYYDTFVKNAFGNYRDILAEASFSPLMAEHLSYLRSKSHSYVFAGEDKRISRADENYAREIMQLFTIGLNVLTDDGTPALDPVTGSPLETYTNEDIESFARAWTGFERTGARGNSEDSRRGTSDNRLDPMRIIPDWRDPFPKAHLNSGFIGDGYMLCKDLPAQSFLKSGAGYRLLGRKSSPELMKDPSWFADDDNNILRLELDPSSDLYTRLYNGGNYELFVELGADIACAGTECNVDTVRVVKVGSIYYEFVERPCIQMAFYDNGKQIQLRDNYRRGQMCANADVAHAREACCREDRVSEVRTATMEQGVTHFYEGERMTWATAQDRCVDYGKDLCVYEGISISPDNDYRRKGYHWTNKDCGINVKVNSEGYIAIVHDAMSTYIDSIPWLVEEENTLNWFKVFWNGGSYPGDSEANTCAVNGCKTMPDGSCLCKTTVAETVVFTDTNVSKQDVMSQLFMGVSSAPTGSSATVLDTNVTVHVVGGNVDGTTVFQVDDKGRTMYLKNILSSVSLEGWTMPPKFYEAEDASINNALVRNNTSSASGGLYVEGHNGNETTHVEWAVDVPTPGTYTISLRYANDNYPRPLSVYVNSIEAFRPLTSPNTVIPVNNIATNPVVDLNRCDGDCDNDSQCADGLFCMARNQNEAVPGCNGTSNRAWDYCVDIDDFAYGFTLLSTGGWDDDWHYSEPLEVSLIAGQNTIRVQLPPEYNAGPNIDYLKIEGLPTSSSSSSFRNPPHFMSLIPDYYPGGLGEQNLRDAQYETDAVLDHLFFQDNIAPFLCIRIMQRFSFSNPSPRYVASCVNAFRTGLYTSGSETFGSGAYGSLEAMASSIFLDKEATEAAISLDPSYGSIKEPIMKVTHLMRSMDYQTSIPTTLDGAPMQETYNTRLWKIDEKIGQGPYEFPTVFSYFLPEYVPDSGPNLPAKLSSPESIVVTMPNVVALLNGMFSMIKYGLSDCNNGFSTYPGYGGCNDNGLYERSYGHLFYEPSGIDDEQKAADLALLLTAGRLNEENLNTIVDACLSETDQPSKTRCMQQLMVTTAEFHTTSTATQSGEDRATDTGVGNSTESYKAIVYFNLAGGLDSYNMLAPHTCAPIDVHDRYMTIRGKSAIAEGVGLPKARLLEIQANNDAQPCSSFGIHQNLTMVKELYDQGKLNFIANAGLLAKPVTVDDYRGETPVQLFAHNAMTVEAQKEDLADLFTGTGIGGRMADVLTQSGVPTNVFSIDGQQVLLTGEVGQGPSQFILSSSGLSTFNANPSISNMDDVIRTLNNETTADSGFHAETWSSKLSQSLSKQQLLKQEVDATSVTALFPEGSTSDEFEMVTRIMQTREVRRSKRDIFFVQDGGYDTHANVDASLINNFSRINGAIEAFVEELKVLGLWESTVVVQFSEFARTLDPNTGDGTDHAWGGQHFMFGGSLNGSKVLGQYPVDFNQGDAANIALSRGRMIPTTPWDAMWKPVAEWFGIPPESAEMDKVLPMHKNFPSSSLYSLDDVFNPPAAPA